jgi:hypothetical protein
VGGGTEEDRAVGPHWLLLQSSGGRPWSGCRPHEGPKAGKDTSTFCGGAC